jgi:UDP-3-O-[3-hydroxymyristoyl] glucosamine N-acyltransferase
MTTRTLSELADLCGAVLQGDGTRVVEGPASLAEASSRHISLFSSPRYRADLDATKAAAVVVAEDLPAPREDLALLRCKDPNRAFTAIIRAFLEDEPAPPAGVHESAIVDATAQIAASASIGPLCWIGPGVSIGERAVLAGMITLGRDASVGAETTLHCGVHAYARVTIGARCIVHSGTVLGSDGYGFEPTREGWAKIPQVGTVVVEDDVEIGANCTIDRGRFGATRIGRGAKLDNLVHIAHNVIVGEAALVIAQVGIAGSAKIGKRVILAGQVGVSGHVTIGDGARIGAQSGAIGDVPPGVDWMGTPARARPDVLRSWTLTLKLPELNQRVRDLERKLARLERSVETAGGDSP